MRDATKVKGHELAKARLVSYDFKCNEHQTIGQELQLTVCLCAYL